ncbi:HAD superfamily phosphatase (TIGR01681 family)/FkbH-like protein [Neorhizobium sp. R1-B]|uniref:HAD-IIIC family phosphatase n=1 Tax=Neorhizobium sp. R1-B TaxID=2485162 RepID=UPI001065D889|nr:HAD family hydrolase [Neorhizobium sp. R1-B]TDX88369.1 HAD superfamily phosphatase (TIGR01681 family)/FkbH-like protein [Neorhizobium sp. R1-B]
MNTLFPWRKPLDRDWDAQAAAIEDALRKGEIPPYERIKGLANQQLRLREQLKTERVAERIDNADVNGFTRMEIGLLGSRTLTYLISPLRAAGLARGLLLRPHEAPYDQVASFAYSAYNCFNRQLDALLVVLDESAFPSPRPLLNREAEDETLRQAEMLIDAIAAAARAKTDGPAIIATLPLLYPISSMDTSTPGSNLRFRLRFNLMLADGAAHGRWLLWDQAALAARVGLERWLDPISFYSAKVPFSIQMCPLAADNITALLAAMKGKSARALILDLDNTLWGGVIGDDGIAGIRLGQNSVEGEAFIAFQSFVLNLRERGVVLAVCSKNDEPVARAPFADHPEMVLREQHLSVFQANWNDKATNISSIAQQLNLGLESLAYVDDNPAERERVRQELPLVATIEVGEDPSLFIDRVVQSGLFDHLPLNSDDLARADSYKGRAKVAELRAQIGNYDEYLTSLEMRMAISPFDDINRPRIVQLINKSNQFNLTTRRYSDEDIRRMEGDASVVGWHVRLDDKFANHGIIGIVIIRLRGSDWEIDTWLQSCRVLERGVEQCLMNTLFEEASKAKVERVIARYIPTSRNQMVAGFYPRLGFEVSARNCDNSVDFHCAVRTYAPHPVFMKVIGPSGYASPY